jgi:hypothetical protein
MKTLLTLCLTIVVLLGSMGVSWSAGYMSCDGETEDGKSWSGECYLYSEKYGDLESAETEDGKEVTGECYKYSSRYAEVESGETEDGKEVTGECSY